MRFKDVFSIIGPAMVGPSSSHTAGAARIGRAARRLFGRQPESAEIVLYGSFAATGSGHGTDSAIVGGLLDMDTDDPRLPSALDLARSAGMHVSFRQGTGLAPHPNTAKLLLTAEGSRLTMTGISIGGGNMEVAELNGFRVNMTGLYPALVILHQDIPGMIAEVTQLLQRERENIGSMTLDRRSRSGEALMVLELDTPPSGALVPAIAALPGIRDITLFDMVSPRREDS